jgi:hypothetical protein
MILYTKRGEWRKGLAAVADEMTGELERSHRDATVPPLFPIGNAAIVGGMLMWHSAARMSSTTNHTVKNCGN